MPGNLTPIADRTPNEKLVGTLENLLAEAKSGELRTLFYVCSWSDDAVSHGWNWDHRTGNRRRIVGEIAMAQQDLIVSIHAAEPDSRLAQVLRGE